MTLHGAVPKRSRSDIAYNFCRRKPEQLMPDIILYLPAIARVVLLQSVSQAV